MFVPSKRNDGNHYLDFTEKKKLLSKKSVAKGDNQSTLDA